MSDLDKILTKAIKRFEKAGRQQSAGVIMMHLMVLQLDGRVELSNETMQLYIDALDGTTKRMNAFRDHCMKQYFQ